MKPAALFLLVAALLTACGSSPAGPLVTGQVTVAATGRDPECELDQPPVDRSTDYVVAGAVVTLTGGMTKDGRTSAPVGSGKLFLTTGAPGVCAFRFAVRVNETARTYTFDVAGVVQGQPVADAALAAKGYTGVGIAAVVRP